jgi:hypothetical protein
MGLLDSVLADDRKRGVLLAVGGMAALAAGRKFIGLGLFSSGVGALERAWRARHPGFAGGFGDRWALAETFYEETHRDPVNRALHLAGIPLILGGAVGLVLSPSWSPPWVVSAGAFVGGWALNVVGHRFFEHNQPAFADDPLSFVAGPVWDLRQLGGFLASKGDARA